jgi:hypothetical protein
MQRAEYGAGEYLRRSIERAVGIRGPFVYKSYKSLIGKNVRKDKSGRAECAFLVQVIMGSVSDPMGVTNKWIEGDYIQQAGLRILPGTVIANFDKTGRYAGNPHGNHAAFFDSFGTSNGLKGIWVVEQYAGLSKIAHRHLPFTSNRWDDPPNNGSAFSVALTTATRAEG